MHARAWIVTVVVTIALLPALVAASPKQELEEQVAAYKKAGQPIEPVDFVVKGVDETQNAASDLSGAARWIDDKAAVWVEAFEQPEDPTIPFTPAEAGALRAVVTMNKTAFERIDAARGKTGMDWKLKIESPVMGVLLPELNKQRMLGKLTSQRALLEHQEGNDAEAVESVRRTLFVARSTGRMPFLVSGLVSQGIAREAATAAGKIAPDLKIGDAGGAVKPDQLRQLIAELLDDGAEKESLRLALLAERMSQLDTANVVADGKQAEIVKLMGGGKDAPDLSKVTPDMALTDALIMMRYTTMVLEATEPSASWPVAKGKLPPLPAEMKQREQHLLLATLLPSVESVIRRNYATIASQRLAAVALAIRWYAVDHDGKRPAKLDDLVPKYLPKLPLDPMAPAEQAMFYLPNAKRPVIYSVGDNGQNDLGTERVIAPAKVRGQPPQVGPMLDIVVYLDRAARPRTAVAEKVQ